MNESRSTFSLFLIQCAKFAGSAVITIFDIICIFLEGIFIFAAGNFWEKDSSSSQLDFLDITNADDENQFSDFFGAQRGGYKFMDKYSIKDIESIIKNGPIGKSLEKVGFSDWYIEFELSDSFNHYLYVRSKRFPAKDQYIAFLIVKIDNRLILKAKSHTPESFEFIRKNIDLSKLNLLYIQWLSLQNPGGTFKPDRPRLPGQRYPGSGIGRSVFLVIRRLCIFNYRDGIMNVPEFFHNAYLYEGFMFLDPVNQAHFEKMKKELENDISHYGLASVSWAIGIGALYLGDEKYEWNLGEQIFPLSTRTFVYFNSPDYYEKVNQTMSNLPKFHIDWEAAKLLDIQL